MRLEQRIVVAATVVFALAGAADADPYGRTHKLATLEPRLAEALVWEICEARAERNRNCAVQAAEAGSVTVFGSDAVHQAVVEMLLERDLPRPRALQFQITLVRAAAENGGRPEKLPRHVQRALDAVSELLSFSHYEVLDSGLIATTSGATTQFVDGEGDTYRVHLEVRSVTTRRAGLELSVELEVIGNQTVDHPMRRLLGSVVTLVPGETVVAGSSSEDGGEALLVLLSALPLAGAG